MDLGEFMEQATIAPAFGPVDMTAAANPGAWVSMGAYARLTAVLIKGAGTGGDDPVITLQQAQDLSGTNAKGLIFSRVRVNQGSPTIPVSGQRFTLFVRDNTGLVEAGATMVDAAPSDIFTLTGGAADQAIVAIDIGLGDLDLNNGFSCVQIGVAKTADSQLGQAFYILFQPRELGQNMVAAQ
jgi:hypothetical protein